MLSNQRHESYRAEILFVEGVLAVAHDLHQPLLVGERADGNDEPSAGRELVAQALRDFRPARRHDDRVERRGLRPAQGAVAAANLDIAIAKPGEPVLGASREPAMSLDRINLRRNAAEHGGRVARAGADLQHSIAGPDFGGFDHQRHDVRLRNCLPLGDGQRTVFVGEFLKARGDESLAGDLPHGVEHALIVHAAGSNLPLHHALAVGREMIELGCLWCHGADATLSAPQN